MHIKCQRWRQKDDDDDAACRCRCRHRVLMHVIRNSHGVFDFETFCMVISISKSHSLFMNFLMVFQQLIHVQLKSFNGMPIQNYFKFDGIIKMPQLIEKTTNSNRNEVVASFWSFPYFVYKWYAQCAWNSFVLEI